MNWAYFVVFAVVAKTCFCCPAGQYISRDGCAYCLPGTYNPTAGSNYCSYCSAGTYNPNQGSTSASACLPCPTGTYNPSIAAASCSTCPTGTVQPSTGASWCLMGTTSGLGAAYGLTSNRIDITVRDNSSGMTHSWATWTTPGSLTYSAWETPAPAGVLYGYPSSAVVSDITGPILNNVVLGGGGILYLKMWDNCWSGWNSLGGLPNSVSASYSPSGVSWGPARMDLFTTGSDGNLYTTNFQIFAGWASWKSLGSPSGIFLISSPAASSWGLNRLDVFTVGSDFTVWQISWNGNSWNWASMGGICSSSPGAVAYTDASGTNHIHLFVRNIGLGISHKSYSSATGWANWSSDVDGALASGVTANGAPAVAVDSSYNLYLYVKGSDGKIYARYFVNSAWSAWSAIGTQTWNN